MTNFQEKSLPDSFSRNFDLGIFQENEMFFLNPEKVFHFLEKSFQEILTFSRNWKTFS